MLQPSSLENTTDLPAYAELPPSYEETINHQTPIIARIWRYAFVTPTRETGTRERWVGPRISSTASAINIAQTSTYEDFVPALGDLAAEQFGWYDEAEEDQGRLAYALLLTKRREGAGSLVVTGRNWEAVRKIVIASSRNVVRRELVAGCGSSEGDWAVGEVEVFAAGVWEAVWG